MADEDESEDLEAETTDAETEDDEDSEGEGEPEGKPKSKSKLILIAGGISGVLILGGVGSYFAGFFGGGTSPEGQTVAEEEEIPTDLTYYEFPQILVNLNEPGRKGKFLKLAIVFELKNSDDISVIEKLEPRIIDQFQMYLRELRFEDLQGSEGVHRLREELLRRVTNEVGKNKVRDVLFKNILVQ